MALRRRCALCGSQRTHVNKNGTKSWHRYENNEGQFLCHTCYTRYRRVLKGGRRDTASELRQYTGKNGETKRVCSLCGVTDSQMKSYGYSQWYFNGGGERLCYRCNLDRLRREREASSGSGALRCQSAICVKNREKLGMTYDYERSARCMRCNTNQPKQLGACPCCNTKLRKKRRGHRKAKEL